MIDGKIEVLGKKQIMLPSDVVYELQKIDPKKIDALRPIIQKNVEDYAKKVGSGEEGLLKNISEIFETFGLGKLEIADMDSKNKKCLTRIHNAPVQKYTEEFLILTVVLSGVFSFLFKKNVQAELKSKGTEYFEYVIK
jgi:hypothetical protein